MIITQFKVGDTVTCSDYGEGTVIKITQHSLFPINVHFEDEDEGEFLEYTADGRSVLGSPITLTKTN